MKAMILAAGRGKRLRPLTDRVPKALVKVGGESLLVRRLKAVCAAGIEDVVINLGWLGEQIVERVGDGSAWGLNVTYSDERTDVLETGGGIYNALPLLGGDPFVVLNADIYTDMPVPQMALADDALGHLVLVPSPAFRPRGDFDIEDGLITNSREQSLTFSGAAIYRQELFADCKAGRFSIVPLLREAADAGILSGSRYDGFWADIGTPERLVDAAQEDGCSYDSPR